MKPTQQEEEYFARLEFERRRKVLEEREPQAAEQERRLDDQVVAEDTGFLGSVRRIFA